MISLEKRKWIAEAAGVKPASIYQAEKGTKRHSDAWLKNITLQAERGKKPKEGEQRCNCCGTIRQESEYKQRGSGRSKTCKNCQRGFINGGKLTWDALDKMTPPPEAQAQIGTYARMIKQDGFPYLMMLAYRVNRLPNSMLEERFGLKKGSAKSMATRIGITDPKKKVYASGKYHARWKGGDDRVKTWGGYWANEQKELRRSTKMASWHQHELSMQWEWRNKYDKKSPEQKIKHRLRNAIRQSIRQQSVQKKTRLAIGCDINFLRQYLENRFKEGMTWENYGSAWHIDHIKPLDLFDLSKKREQMKANHYTNLQPLWAFENQSKSNKTMKQYEMF